MTKEQQKIKEYYRKLNSAREAGKVVSCPSCGCERLMKARIVKSKDDLEDSFLCGMCYTPFTAEYTDNGIKYKILKK